MAMNQGRDTRYTQNYNRASMGSGVANASFEDSAFEADYDADANTKVRSGLLAKSGVLKKDNSTLS